MRKVCIMGLGYIGLPTAAVLASKDFFVHGADIAEDIVERVNAGDAPIDEPALGELLKTAVKSGRLQAFSQPAAADIYIVAVPTPFTKDRRPDLSCVESAARAIAPYLKDGNLVILESTCPVGTTERLAGWLKELRPDLAVPAFGQTPPLEGQIFIAYCPERVLPGDIINELTGNDRIAGGIDRASAEKAKEFYRNFVRGEIFLTDARTAELAKLAENSFRDVNIAFANELSLISDKLKINIWELIDLANKHPRVNILRPGPGVGGHCIAVDPWFIVDGAPKEAKLIRAAREVNDRKPDYIAKKILKIARQIKNPVIACLGLAFKANVGDLRESPAITVVEMLAQAGGSTVLAVEPHIATLPLRLASYENIKHASVAEAVEQADIVILLVEHQIFGGLGKSMPREKVVIDTRGLWR